MSADQLFAVYEPREKGGASARPPAELTVRAAQPVDANGIARLVAQREGKPFDEGLERTISALAKDAELGNFVAVAAIGEIIVGFGRARYIRIEASESDAPEGWYLLGVIVDPRFRRRGIGAELTRVRLEWIGERAREVYYFANSLNRATVDLHERFGFMEVRRGFTFPGAHFSGGGVGILFRAEVIPP